MKPCIVCFGEILWDALPAGLFAGGAPMNVGYHAHRQGAEVVIASATGYDRLGKELLRRIGSWGIDCSTIPLLPGKETGFVEASIGADGNASYKILEDVAWDSIPLSSALEPACKRADALVFGSLAQRSRPNRETLRACFDLLPAHAEVVFDVNLRPPHDDLSLVSELASMASLMKLNHDEAARLCGQDSPQPPETLARLLHDQFPRLESILITAASEGAGVLTGGRWFFEEGRKVNVADTVGAGDAFLARYLICILGGHAPETALEKACRTGEWVASQRGATPDYIDNQ